MSGNNSMQEYTFYVDTHNADKKFITNNEIDTNPTNDIIIPVRFPQRLTVAQVNLGSLEIPLTQYNIEKDWQTLYFDEGIDLFVLDPSQESILQMTIEENKSEYTIQLPPKLNPIISINPDSSPTTTAIFTTQYPHALHLRAFFNWGEPMKLINTPLNDTDFNQVTYLTTDNVSLTILSDYEFQLSWTTPVTFTVPVSGINGYVSTPSIPSPKYLASLVTLAFQYVIPNHWNVSYDIQTGKYKLSYVGTTFDLSDVYPATLVISGNNSLARIMGFGCASINIPLPLNSTLSHTNDSKTLCHVSEYSKNRGNIPELVTNGVYSVECSSCRSRVKIDPGNYSPESLMNNLSRQLNRFYFDPGCNFASSPSPTSSSPVQFVYSTKCGVCYTIQIPFGLYDPDNLATMLESKISPNIPSIEVIWDINTGQFQFKAEEDFGLEFDVGTPDVAFRLGFYPISYRNNRNYQSTIPFYYPTKGCCGTSLPDRHLSYVYNPLVNGNQKKFIIEVSRTRAISTTGPFTYDSSEGTLTIVISLPMAHGYQILDVVEVTVGGKTYEMVVSSVDAFDRFTVDLGSIDPAIFTSLPLDSVVCLSLGGIVATNLYFTCLDNDVLAMTLGYNEEDVLWNLLQPTTWIPPACYMLDWPQYVLLELTEPIGATHNLHAWRQDAEHVDTHAQVLAKVILYPQFRMERSFPFTMSLPDLKIINRIKVRVLNPNHTLYNFHSRNWSMTLVFHALEKSVQLLCY